LFFKNGEPRADAGDELGEQAGRLGGRLDQEPSGSKASAASTPQCLVRKGRERGWWASGIARLGQRE